MRQLTTSTTYNHTIVILPTNAFYSRPCSFHTFYENHESNDLQILSIKSCAYHHKEENFKVIMWMRSNNPLLNDTNFRTQFATYKNITIETVPDSEITLESISDHIIYNHGGCFFEPNFIFMRSMQPLFWTYGTHVGVFQVGTTKTFRTDMKMCLPPRSEIYQKYMNGQADNRILIFPSSWIDPIGVENPFASLNDYATLFKTSVFNASLKSYCVYLGKDPNHRVEHASFVHECEQSLTLT